MQNNDIAKILDLKDKNIIFSKNFINEEVIKGKRVQVYTAKLKYKPSYCEVCGVINEDNNIISKGYSKPSLIKLNKVSNINAYMRLIKQRYYCKECNSSFTLKTSLVDKHCFISKPVKYKIALDAGLKRSEKDIAKDNNVSSTTVTRVIDSAYIPPLPYTHHLPEVIGMDEFKSVKSAEGAMSFIFTDLEARKLIDIVEDRKLHNLERYFSKYTKEARDKVRIIVIDMYEPYIQLIKKMFINAQIVVDKFHLVQLMSRSLQKTRIKVMKSVKKYSVEYRLLKKHFKLLTKYSVDLDSKNYRRYTKSGPLLTQTQLVDKMVDVDPELKEAYDIYQDYLYALKTKNIKVLAETAKQYKDVKSSYMATSLKTVNKYLPYIENSFKYDYTNGFVEGFNNLIKVIKRIAFGYSSFIRFRNRIMIISKNMSIEKEIKPFGLIPL